MKINREQTLILAELKASKAIKPLRGLTASELSHKIPGNIKQSIIYRNALKLRDIGLVNNGIKVSRQHSYYITQMGIQVLDEEKNKQ